MRQYKHAHGNPDTAWVRQLLVKPKAATYVNKSPALLWKLARPIGTTVIPLHRLTAKLEFSCAFPFRRPWRFTLSVISLASLFKNRPRLKKQSGAGRRLLGFAWQFSTKTAVPTINLTSNFEVGPTDSGLTLSKKDKPEDCFTTAAQNVCESGACKRKSDEQCLCHAFAQGTQTQPMQIFLFGGLAIVKLAICVQGGCNEGKANVNFLVGFQQDKCHSGALTGGASVVSPVQKRWRSCAMVMGIKSRLSLQSIFDTAQADVSCYFVRFSFQNSRLTNILTKRVQRVRLGHAQKKMQSATRSARATGGVPRHGKWDLPAQSRFSPCATSLQTRRLPILHRRF